MPVLFTAGLMCLLYFIQGKTYLVLSILFYLYALINFIIAISRLSKTMLVWGPNVKSYSLKMKALDKESIAPIIFS